MLSVRARVFLACTAIIVLGGCSADPSASEAPESSASEAPTQTGPDPILESIPADPYGYSEEEVRQLLTGQETQLELDGMSTNYGIYLDLGERSSVDLTGAVITALQIDWVGAQRDTMYNGWRVENLQGHVRDIKRFVAPSAMQNYLPAAEEALAMAEERTDEDSSPADADREYKLHAGKISQVDAGPSKEDEAAWPEHQDAVVWIHSAAEDGMPEQSVPIPLDEKAVWSPPMINQVSATGEAGSHSVVIQYTNAADVVMADGDVFRMILDRSVQLGYENGKWGVQDSTWEISNSGLAE